MSFILYFPATCELCGHWIPKHAGDCPRNGVHPSQWSLCSSTDTIKSNNSINGHEHDANIFPLTYQLTEDDEFAVNLYPNTYLSQIQ